jgi:orotate phosphoribosyltransferase
MKDNLTIMKQCEAFLEGHFLLSSGRHSGGYCQCAKAAPLSGTFGGCLSTVTEQVKNLPITKVCGPAMGGVIVSYELARQLGVESIFTERKDGEMQLRRGFTVGKGDKILIAEDVITTGKIDHGDGQGVGGYGRGSHRRRLHRGSQSGEDCDFALPVYAALKLSIDS